MQELFGYLSGVLSLSSYFPYILDILAGETKPERATWFIWTIIGAIAFFSQLATGAQYSLYLVSAQELGNVTIFLLSIKYGTGGFTRKDIAAIVVSFLGLIIWYITHEAAYALYAVIAIDSIGGFLTMYKLTRYPKSETLNMWLLSGLSGIAAIFAVKTYNTILLSYPIYTVLVNGVISIMIVSYPLKKKFKLCKKQV